MSENKIVENAVASMGKGVPTPQQAAAAQLMNQQMQMQLMAHEVEKIKAFSAAVTAGIMTVEEARKLTGLDKLDKVDEQPVILT